jgi:hypothetical protein
MEAQRTPQVLRHCPGAGRIARRLRNRHSSFSTLRDAIDTFKIDRSL